MSVMVGHSDSCVWRTNNNVNHKGVPNLEDCKCDCHE